MTSPSHDDRIVLAGASGLIGTALAESLRADGWEVHSLVRRSVRHAHEHEWDPARGELDPRLIEGARAVVSLGGASVGHFPWTKTYREALRSSRLQPTQTIARALRSLGTDAPPFVSASAVGYYGSAPGITLDEHSPAGGTFLAELCVEWERSAFEAGSQVPVATLRTAPVVHPDGVLKPLMLLTRLGLAGPIGRGTQFWPWITLDDEVAAIRHVIDRGLTGPINLTGPEPATANDLGRALARRMKRPFLVPVPTFALKAVLGKDATEGLLTSDARVLPQALIDSGFAFRHQTVTDAVAAALPS